MVGFAAYSGPGENVELGLLQDVGGVDAPLEPPIEPQADHPPQPVAVPVEKLGQRGRIAGFGTADQVVGFTRCGHQIGPSPLS